MTTRNLFSKVGFVLAIAAVVALPNLSYAATYAYVNNNGEVSAVTANDANSAIATAPNRDMHSGVMLLTNQTGNGIVGDQVSGI